MAENDVNREYKSSLFAWIFSDREAALSLYNSINGTEYDDPDSLEFTTIDTVIYMGMKNDVAFLFGGEMNLYEHQATWNPNMPLRGLFYFSEMYRGYVESRKLNIYSSVQLKLPVPRYVVFYNGTNDEPEWSELRLSDAFEPGTGRASKGIHSDMTSCEARTGSRQPSLECTVQVININFGCNRELMKHCRKLYEYSYFVNAVRRRLKEGMTLGAASDEAVKECIQEGVLEEFLSKHRAEVTKMILEEFDLERHMQSEKQLSYEEGREEGRQEGREEGREKSLIKHICRALSRGNSPAEIADLLGEKLSLVEAICGVAGDFAPDYNEDKIYEALKRGNK